jgi:hypothetical protein
LLASTKDQDGYFAYFSLDPTEVLRPQIYFLNRELQMTQDLPSRIRKTATEIQSTAHAMYDSGDYSMSHAARRSYRMSTVKGTWLKKKVKGRGKKEGNLKRIHLDASVVKIDDLILEAQLINCSLQKGVQCSTAARQLQNKIATTVSCGRFVHP